MEQVIAAVIAGGVAMGGGLLTVAWKLGALSRAIEDLGKRIDRIEEGIDHPRRGWPQGFG
jgi:outer membrane murein-binding lipoprotein Lpp